MSEKKMYQIAVGVVIILIGAIVTYYQYSITNEAYKKEKDKGAFVMLLVLKELMFGGTGLGGCLIFVFGIFLLIGSLLN